MPTEKTDTYAYFWVSGFEDESDITDLIGLEPTDISTNKFGLRHWSYESARSSVAMDAHIESLLAVLSDRKLQIDKLRHKFNVGINCVGYYYGSNPGFHLGAELIRDVAKLGISIDFDLYKHTIEEQ